MGDVEQLKTPAFDEADPNVAITFDMQVGEGRALRMSTTFFQSMPVELVDHRLRAFLGILDQLKASYELQDLRWQVALRERSLARMQEDIDRLDTKHDKRRAEIDVELATLRGELAETGLNHEREFRKTGRQGKFSPSQAQQRELQDIQLTIEKLVKESAHLSDAVPEDRRQLLEGMARAKLDVSSMREEIEKRLMVLGLPSELT